MRVAYHLARRTLPEHACKFSRHDYTLAQLFACLVVREFFGLSFRRAEALLSDSPAWLADIGLQRAPDHNTLWRAFERLLAGRRCGRMLDLLAELFVKAKLLPPQRRRRIVALDSTCFERRHRSGHYDRRCRRMALDKEAKRPGKWGESVNAARSDNLRRMPKLAIAVDAGCHLILAACTRIGNGSDSPDFAPLLRRANRRVRGGVAVVVADAGYDGEHNHRLAREQLGVRSLIPAAIGRPTRKPPGGRWRRHVSKRLKQPAGKKQYGQRAQSETTHSMIKRNLSSALRSRTPERQKKEMMLRVLVHNIALLCDELEG